MNVAKQVFDPMLRFQRNYYYTSDTKQHLNEWQLNFQAIVTSTAGPGVALRIFAVPFIYLTYSNYKSKYCSTNGPVPANVRLRELQRSVDLRAGLDSNLARNLDPAARFHLQKKNTDTSYHYYFWGAFIQGPTS